MHFLEINSQNVICLAFAEILQIVLTVRTICSGSGDAGIFQGLGCCKMIEISDNIP